MHQFIERHCQIKKSSFCKLLHILLLKPGLHESNPLESAICVISYKHYGTPTNSQLLPQINVTLSVGHCTRASEEGFALLCQVLDFHWEQPVGTTARCRQAQLTLPVPPNLYSDSVASSFGLTITGGGCNPYQAMDRG